MVSTHHATFVIFGGSNGQLLNDVWLFDCAAKQWLCLNQGSQQQQQAEFEPVARSKHASVAINGSMIIHGGTTGMFHESDMWLFIPATKSWIPCSFMNTSNGTAANNNSSMLNFSSNALGNINGGYNAASVPVPRDSHSLAIVNRYELWMFGGAGKGT